MLPSIKLARYKYARLDVSLLPGIIYLFRKSLTSLILNSIFFSNSLAIYGDGIGFRPLNSSRHSARSFFQLVIMNPCEISVIYFSSLKFSFFSLSSRKVIYSLFSSNQPSWTKDQQQCLTNFCYHLALQLPLNFISMIVNNIIRIKFMIVLKIITHPFQFLVRAHCCFR